MMMIHLTDSAQAEVRRLMAERKLEGMLLRVGIQNGGCSGMQYSMDFERRSGENDQVFDLGDVKVVCDREALAVLSGLVVDFSGALMGGGFKFHNPNATRSCGCGTSFRV
jgi:iron-sulfur cluster assembly protein